MGQYHPGMTLEGAGIVKGTGNVPPPPQLPSHSDPLYKGTSYGSRSTLGLESMGHPIPCYQAHPFAFLGPGWDALASNTHPGMGKAALGVTRHCCSCCTGTSRALPVSAAAPALAGDTCGSHGAENQGVQMPLVGVLGLVVVSSAPPCCILCAWRRVSPWVPLPASGAGSLGSTSMCVWGGYSLLPSAPFGRRLG